MSWADQVVAGKVNSKHILEVRFRPMASVLDTRGELTEKLSQKLGLPNWSVGKDRLDLSDPAKLVRAFVGHRNAGFVVQEVREQQTFAGSATAFIRELMSLWPFAEGVHVARIGVRLTVAVPSADAFEALAVRLVGPGAGRVANLRDATVTDLALIADYSDETGFFHTQIGPMKRSEIVEAFQWELKDGRVETAALQPEFPEVAVFGDVDYWVLPAKSMRRHEIERHVTTLTAGCWSRMTEMLAAYELEASSGK